MSEGRTRNHTKENVLTTWSLLFYNKVNGTFRRFNNCYIGPVNLLSVICSETMVMILNEKSGELYSLCNWHKAKLSIWHQERSWNQDASFCPGRSVLDCSTVKNSHFVLPTDKCVAEIKSYSWSRSHIFRQRKDLNRFPVCWCVTSPMGYWLKGNFILLTDNNS